MPFRPRTRVSHAPCRDSLGCVAIAWERSVKTLTHFIAACALPFALAAAQAEEAREFPSRTVRLVVPAAPGGPIDAVGRILADGLKAASPRPHLALAQSLAVEGLGEPRFPAVENFDDCLRPAQLDAADAAPV